MLRIIHNLRNINQGSPLCGGSLPARAPSLRRSHPYAGTIQTQVPSLIQRNSISRSLLQGTGLNTLPHLVSHLVPLPRFHLYAGPILTQVPSLIQRNSISRILPQGTSLNTVSHLVSLARFHPYAGSIPTQVPSLIQRNSISRILLQGTSLNTVSHLVNKSNHRKISPHQINLYQIARAWQTLCNLCMERLTN